MDAIIGCREAKIVWKEMGWNLEQKKLLQYQNALDVLDLWMDNYNEHELINRIIMI